MQKYKTMDTKDVQSKKKKEGKRKRDKNKDNPCFRKNSTREKYILKSIVELGEPPNILRTCTS